VAESSGELTEVSVTAVSVAQSSNQVDEQAAQLKGLADELATMVIRFRV